MAFWIVTDACCDLPAEYIARQKDLHVVPMAYQINGQVHEINLTDSTLPGRVHEFYNQLLDGAIATTFQVTHNEWVEHVEPLLEQGHDVLILVFSSSLSGMRSDKPVLCCKLEGIPEEYDEYLRYIEPQTAQGIRDAVQTIVALSPEERNAIGERARRFVLEKKNNVAQSAKLLLFLRDMKRPIQ